MPRVKSLSRELRQARADRGLTVADVAGRLGVSAMAVYNWESGRSRPRPDNLRQLCKVLRMKQADAQAMGV